MNFVEGKCMVVDYACSIDSLDVFYCHSKVEREKKKKVSQNILNTLKERTIYNSGSTVIPSREDLQTKTSPRRVSDNLLKLGCGCVWGCVCACVCVCVCVCV